VEKHGEIPRWWIPISSMGVVYIPTFTIHFQPNGVWSIWGMVHLPTWMARIHGKLVGKYNIPVPLSIWDLENKKKTWLLKLYIYSIYRG